MELVFVISYLFIVLLLLYFHVGVTFEILQTNRVFSQI